MTVPTLTSFTGQLPDYGDPASFDSRMFALRTWHLDTFNPELQAIVAAFNTDLADFNSDYGNFDVLYLGPKASAPTLDNSGNALVAGARYWNTTTQGEFVWNGTGWISTAYNSANVAITGGAIDNAVIGAVTPAAITGTDIIAQNGIYLGGTGAPNLLDDYEEGTWTPTIKGTSTAGSPTYIAQNGWYVKTGKIVTVGCSITLSAIGGMAGNVRIDSLPFTSDASTTSDEAIGLVRLNDVTTQYENYIGLVISGTTEMAFRSSNANTDQTLVVSDLNSTATVGVQVSYLV